MIKREGVVVFVVLGNCGSSYIFGGHKELARVDLTFAAW